MKDRDQSKQRRMPGHSLVNSIQLLWVDTLALTRHGMAYVSDSIKAARRWA